MPHLTPPIPHLTRTLFIAVSLIGFVFIKSCTSETPVTNSPDILSPTFDNCPTSPIVMNVAMGDLDTVVITFPTPITASDNSSSVTLSATTIPDSASITIDDTTDSARPTNTGGTFPLGDTTVTLTASDGSPNSQDATCTFTVTVNAFGTPTFADTCPTDSSFTLEEVVAGMTTRTWTAPTATIQSGDPTTLTTNIDPSGSIILLDPPNQEGHDSSFTFNEPSTTITYTATDPISNNQATCSFTVTIEGLTSREPRFDICVPTQLFPLGTALIPDEDTPSISFTTEDSTLTTPTLTIPTDLGSSTATIEWNIPTALTDINIPLMVDAGAATPTLPINVVDNTMPPRASATFTLGTSVTITYLATDPNGDDPSATLSTCSFTITVEDTEPPAITNCPTNYAEPLLDIAVNTDPDSPTAFVTWGTSGLTAGSPRPIFAADNSGSVTLTVSSSTLPPGSAPDATPVENVDTVTINIDSTTDATMPSNANGTFPISETTVTFTATDNNNNRSTCSFTVTVTDNQVPTIDNCPASISITLAPGTAMSIVTWGETGIESGTATSIVAADNSLSVTLAASSSTLPPGSALDATPVENAETVIIDIDDTTASSSGGTFPAGVTTVIFTATDSETTVDTCMFTVTVADKQAPMIVGCPESIVRNAGSGQTTLVVTWTLPTATDNVDTSPSLTSSHTPDFAFPVGITTVTYTATDSSGNINNTCSFSVDITSPDSPRFTNCPPTDFTVNSVPSTAANAITTGQGLPTATVAWDTPTATTTPTSGTPVTGMNLAGPFAFSGTVTELPADPQNNNLNLMNGGDFPIGTTTVFYTATNPNNNKTTTCSFAITVVDDENPIFPASTLCPNASTINGAENTPVSWASLLIATDNSGTPPTYTATASPASRGDINEDSRGGTFLVGDTIVTVTAMDSAAPPNTATCTFTVTIADSTPPTISCGINDPQNSDTLTTTINVDAMVDITTLSWIVETSDNSGTMPTLSSTFMRTSGPLTPQATIDSDHLGGTFPIGEFTVTLTATDGASLSANCQLTITVNDRVPPTISACSSSNSPFAATTTNPMVTVSWTVTAMDNSGITPTSFSYEVTSSDNTNVITTANPSGGTTPITITFTTSSSEAGFPAGKHTIAVTAMDANNNPSEPCTFTVTVDDEIPPVIAPADCSALGATLPTTTDDPTQLPHSWTIIATDNLDSMVALTYTFMSTGTSQLGNAPVLSIAPNASNADFPIGIHTIEVTATDDNSQTATCSFTVTVTDGVDPTLICPDNVDAVGTAGGTVDVTWDAATATDNFDSTLIVTYTAPMTSTALSSAINQTTTSAMFLVPTGTDVYTAEITASVSDTATNSANCKFTITVSDKNNAPPVITSCPEDRTVTVSSISGTVDLQWRLPTATTGEGGTPIDDVGLPTATRGGSDFAMTDDPSFMDDFVFERSGYYDYDTTDLGAVGRHGNTFMPGEYVITYTVGTAPRTATCSFTYTIRESGLPLFTTLCPADITATVRPGETIPLVWTEPVAITIIHQGLDGVNVMREPVALSVSNNMSLPITIGNPTARFPSGSATVTYTATGTGSPPITRDCSFTVTVTEDANAPASPPEGSLFFLSNDNEAPSSNNPFLIHNANDLRNLAAAANSGMRYTIGNDTGPYTDADYRLESNLTLVGENNFTPIGTDASRFQGNFDGNSKSIMNMHYESDTSMATGLFGVISNATITNLTLDNPTIIDTNASNLGALAGRVIGTDSKLDKVFISGGTITGVQIDSSQNIGGIVGNNEGALTRSFSSAELIASASSMGGAVGVNSGIITRVVATGNVSLPNPTSLGSGLESQAAYGGLVGLHNGNGARLTASAAFGDVTVRVVSISNYIGGLVGRKQTTNAIEASYASGDVKLTGIGGTASSPSIGGFIGRIDNIGAVSNQVINSYSSGGVDTNDVDTTGNSNSIRGFIGSVSRTALQDNPTYSYWNTAGNRSEQSDFNGVGISGSQLRQPTGYTTQVSGVPIDTGTGIYSDGASANYAIYSNWNNTLTLHGIDDSGGTTETTTNPWEFGTSSDYPALRNLIMGLNEDGSDIPFTPALQRNQ